MERHRGQRRFWVTLENRFTAYYWPQVITVHCTHCGAKARFSPAVRDCHKQEGNCWRVVRLSVGGEKEGTGTCTACGRSFRKINWPADAYYAADVRGGAYWAWNEDYLQVLRARVTGNRVLERQLCVDHFSYHYFLTRLPKRVVITRNREAIVRRIDGWFAALRTDR